MKVLAWCTFGATAWFVADDIWNVVREPGPVWLSVLVLLLFLALRTPPVLLGVSVLVKRSLWMKRLGWSTLVVNVLFIIVVLIQMPVHLASLVSGMWHLALYTPSIVLAVLVIRRPR